MNKKIKTSQEYEKLKAFFLAYTKYFYNVKGLAAFSPETAISSVVNLEKYSLSKRISGFRQAANDFVEMTIDFTLAEIKEMDAYLDKEGAPTLSYFRSKNMKLIKRILKKSIISTELEYYALKCYIENEWENIGEEEMKVLNSKISTYEKANSSGDKE